MTSPSFRAPCDSPSRAPHLPSACPSPPGGSSGEPSGGRFQALPTGPTRYYCHVYDPLRVAATCPECVCLAPLCRCGADVHSDPGGHHGHRRDDGRSEVRGVRGPQTRHHLEERWVVRARHPSHVGRSQRRLGGACQVLVAVARGRGGRTRPGLQLAGSPADGGGRRGAVGPRAP